ncbi:MAG: chemotaxis protein CheD [Aureliella sp.]
MADLERAAHASIRMGEMNIASDGEELRTLLGSCVGLALYDSRQRVGGLAHIVLPDSRGSMTTPGKFADLAIPVLISLLSKKTSRKLSLTAKIAGGASMFKTTAATNIGLLNIEACENILRELRVPIIGRHCGGGQGRRMTLKTGDGKVVIEIVGQPPVEL